MFKVVLSHPLHPDGLNLLKKQNDVETIIVNESTTDIVNEYLSYADAFILRMGKLTREMMENCPSLKVITRPGVGVDAIDVSYAASRGIPIVITPGCNTRSVVEHTIMLLLALAKNFSESYDQVRLGNYNVRNKYVSMELLGKSIGILGFGNIGKEVAKLCAALGMKVIVYDPYVQENTVSLLGFTYARGINEIFEQSDVVTVHLPSSDETKKLIDSSQLARMKKGSLFINCARGDIVDEQALYEALVSGKLGGVAVDTMIEEPFSPSHPIFSLPNFIATPHMAGLSKESASRVAIMAVEGTLALLRGQEWQYVYQVR